MVVADESTLFPLAEYLSATIISGHSRWGCVRNRDTDIGISARAAQAATSILQTTAGDERKGYDKRKSKSHSPRVHRTEFHLGVSERMDGGLASLLASCPKCKHGSLPPCLHFARRASIFLTPPRDAPSDQLGESLVGTSFATYYVLATAEETGPTLFSAAEKDAMKKQIIWSKVFSGIARKCSVVLCAALLVPGDEVLLAQAQQQGTAAAQQEAAKIPPDQLDSLVAPIALYPDPMLAQVLAASTYPLEIIQLQQWLQQNPNLKDKALADAVAKQPWDPSVQALAGLPDVVKRLADDIQWTTDLGNAFLAQQSDVMDAVQRMRKKAQDKGNLKSTEQQKVETKVVESKSVIVIEQANPQVVYVPSYDPVVVYGPPVYPYPPIYYPPWGYYAAGVAISFGVGVMMGAFWSGGWGWGCGWGGNNDITINNNNNFNRNSNIGGGNRPSQLPNRGNLGGAGGVGGVGGVGGAGGVGGPGGVGGGNRASTLPAGGGNKWQHNPQHRGGAPYRDRATADRFGGTTRGDSLANRQASARQQVGRQGGNLASNRAAGGGVSNRAAGGARGGDRRAGGGANSIGGRDLSRSGGGNRDAFGGGSRGSRGYDGSSARSSGSRGASSMGSRGGGSRGGGGGRRR